MSAVEPCKRSAIKTRQMPAVESKEMSALARGWVRLFGSAVKPYEQTFASSDNLESPERGVQGVDAPGRGPRGRAVSLLVEYVIWGVSGPL